MSAKMTCRSEKATFELFSLFFYEKMHKKVGEIGRFFC